MWEHASRIMLVEYSDTRERKVETLAPSVYALGPLNAARNSTLVRGDTQSEHAIPHGDVHLIPFYQERFGIVVLNDRLGEFELRGHSKTRFWKQSVTRCTGAPGPIGKPYLGGRRGRTRHRHETGGKMLCGH